MEISRDDKHQRLREAGIVTSDDVPDQFRTVIDSLTPDELEMLVSVKKRLDLASEASGADPGEVFVAP